MRRQLAEGNAKAAAATYRDAMTVLATHPDSVDAFSMHWLGEQALTEVGNRGDAALAHARASNALHAMRGELSGGLLNSFNAAANVRAFEGTGHGP